MGVSGRVCVVWVQVLGLLGTTLTHDVILSQRASRSGFLRAVPWLVPARDVTSAASVLPPGDKTLLLEPGPPEPDVSLTLHATGLMQDWFRPTHAQGTQQQLCMSEQGDEMSGE